MYVQEGPIKLFSTSIIAWRFQRIISFLLASFQTLRVSLKFCFKINFEFTFFPFILWCLQVWYSVPVEVTLLWHGIYLSGVSNSFCIEDMLKVIKEKFKEPEPEEPKPEPTTEILFLCCYEGCNKAFPNEGQYRKHAHTHGERQFACSFPGCGKVIPALFCYRCFLTQKLLWFT